MPAPLVLVDGWPCAAGPAAPRGGGRAPTLARSGDGMFLGWGNLAGTWPRRSPAEANPWPRRSPAHGLGVEVNLRGTGAPFVVAVDRCRSSHPLRRQYLPSRSVLRWPGRRRSVSRRPGAAAGRAVCLVRLQSSVAGPRPAGTWHRLPHRRRPSAPLALEARTCAPPPRGERGMSSSASTSPGIAGCRSGSVCRMRSIRAIRIPLPLAGAITAFHKIAQRCFDGISSVAVAFATTPPMELVPSCRHRPRRRAAATPVRAPAGAAERILRGWPWLPDTACGRGRRRWAGQEGILTDDHRATAGYPVAPCSSSVILELYARNHRRDEVHG